jgi:hypothetical protein
MSSVISALYVCSFLYRSDKCLSVSELFFTMTGQGYSVISPSWLSFISALSTPCSRASRDTSAAAPAVAAAANEFTVPCCWLLELLLDHLFYFPSDLRMKASPTYMCPTSQYLAAEYVYLI